MKNKILKCCYLFMTLSFISLHLMAQTTLILQPGATAGKDAIVNNYPSAVNTNFGSSGEFPASAWTAGGTPSTSRSFIWFNLSSIPLNSSIVSASLSLYAVDAGAQAGQHSPLSGANNGWLQRVIASWDESTITWNNQPASTMVNRVSLPASDSASQDYVLDVSQLMQDILSDPSGNFGLMLVLDNEQYYRRLNFNSSDYSIASKRPKLVITYCSPPAATITPSGPINICSGSSVLLNANTGIGYSYQWRMNGNNIPGATTQSYAAGTSGYYSVIVSNASGCPGVSASVIVTVGNEATIFLRPDGISGNDALVINYPSYENTNFGSSDQFPASAWTAGGLPSTARSFIRFDLSSIPPNSSIISANLSLYAVDAGATVGQHSTLSGANNGWLQRIIAPWDESTITWNNQPSSTLQNRVSLHVSSGPAEDYPDIDVTALMQDLLAVPSSNFGLMLILDNETYYRRLNFCSGDYTDSTKRPKLVLTYTYPDTAIITPSGPVTFCSGSSVLLNANTGIGFIYQWKKNGNSISGATNASYFAVSSGNYSVIVTNSAGCSAMSSALAVITNPLPSASITSVGSTTFCTGGSVLLNAPVASNRLYQWKKNGIDISGATVASYSAASGGTYKVSVTNIITGCVKISASGVKVTVNSLPSATITPQGPTTFCAGGSVVLAANTGAGLTYKWKKGSNYISGATLSNYTATIGGNYRVQVTNSNGCSKTSGLVAVSVPCKEGESVNVGERESVFDVNVYPNPNSGEFTVKVSIKPTSPVQIELTDEIGKVVKKFEMNDETVVIKESNLAKGIYYLSGKSKETILCRKKIIVI